MNRLSNGHVQKMAFFYRLSVSEACHTSSAPFSQFHKMVSNYSTYARWFGPKMILRRPSENMKKLADIDFSHY